MLDNSGFGKTIDYLQIDCEPAENTFTALKKIPFDEYKFAVITFEHDYYKEVLDGVTDKKVRERSREFLISKGYILVAGDIAPDYINSYEDWWVHPELVPAEVRDRFERMAIVDY